MSNKENTPCLNGGRTEVPEREAAMARGRRKTTAETGEGALIDWHESERNAHLLDWRARAHEFGVVPVDQGEGSPSRAFETPEQLLDEEEPEAYRAQAVDGDEEAEEEVTL